MIRQAESKSFLGKAGLEKRDPAERLGFFSTGKSKLRHPEIAIILIF
jgi:hypothetical protein